LKIQIDSENWKNLEKDVDIFFQRLEEVMSELCGVDFTFHLRKNKMEIILDANANFSANLPFIQENITHSILDRMIDIVTKSSEEDQRFDLKILQTISRDISLSFIFNNYINLNPDEQYRCIQIVNELKNISLKTYESKPVDIGVIYCKNDQSLEQLTSLNLDIIQLPEQRTISQFFLEEKPLLRLIDNKSLAVVVDSNFNISSLARKKPDGKGLSYVLESQFNKWAISDVQKSTYNYLYGSLGEVFSTFAIIDSGPREVLSKLTEILQNHEPVDCPNFTYFSIQNREMKIFTDQKFVISYAGGEWKLKHYNLMLATFMILFTTTALKGTSDSEIEHVEKKLQDLTRGLLKLTDIIQNISRNGSSSIFVVILKGKQSKLLSKGSAKQILIDNNFEKNNCDRNFLNAIYDDQHHIKINDADQYLVESIASVDGAVILDADLNIVSFGEIISIPSDVVYNDTFGTGTKAARYASSLGLAIKISEDGDISIFVSEKLLLKI